MSAPADPAALGRQEGDNRAAHLNHHQLDDETRPHSRDTEVNPGEARSTLESVDAQLQAEQRKETSSDLEKNDDFIPFNLQEWLRDFSQGANIGDDKASRKRLGVSWENVDVIGTASMDLKVPTIPGMALYEVIGPIFKLLKMFGINPVKQGQRKLLQNFTGVAKPGEMVLVLGRPGSGCSTFLKTIADKRNGFIRVDGDVHYGGIDAKEMDKYYRGQVVYSEEDDVHNATLTVCRTIDFALRLKANAHALPDQTQKTFRKLIRDTMLKAFNIEHTKHTLVGSPTVRGVSGGERKRVSIIEALCSNATVLSWDNSSRGLDASTAYDYAKSMRVLTDFLQATMFVSLYQASDLIFNEFDKVLVIDDGRCVYYGPREHARQYFIDLGFADRPRQTAADWITGCTDEHERIYQEGHSEADVPSTPEELEAAYKKSEICQKVLQDKAAYDAAVRGGHVDFEKTFRAAVIEEKHSGVGKRSQYTVSWPAQVYALWLRQMQMIIGDKFDIFMSYVTSIVLAFVTGGIFFDLPTTSAGVFTRGGAIFLMLLFSSLTAFAELPTMMLGRPILARQAGFAFFRPSAQTVAALLADFPFGIPRSTAFVVILYLMAGLERSAAGFFTAWFIVMIAYYSFRALFTFFGAVTRDFYGAARLAAVVMTMLVLWAGYVIPQAKMARWLYWVSYLNPIFYAFEALMINEFKRITFTCEAANIVPSGPGYNADGISENQICTIVGATAGTDLIPGMAYLSGSFGYDESNLWRNVGILLAFLFGLVAMCCASMEFSEQGAFSSAMTVKKPSNKEEAALNERLASRRSGATEKTERKLEVYGKPFTWSNLKYTVPVKGGHRQLLDSVDGYVLPGTMTALMGSSGAGKTTLLDVLADRKTIGVIEGDRLVEGKRIDISFQRQCGYAEQQDIHEPMCSVREALRFSAYLRQPYETSIEEKNEYVEDIIELLELHDLADAIIGYPAFGLGVGDRKRVTIGVELAAKPSMLLFLDEPTSGLDGQSAFTICRVLKKLADAGQTILCTIHQPSSLLFETFDRLLLLQRGGQVVYNGPVGKDGHHLIKYFADRGAPCPPGANPAEFMLDAIGAGSQPRMGKKDWADHYRESEQYQENLRKIEEINREGAELPSPKVDGRSEYAAPWLFQFKVVLKRTMLSTWRQPSYQYTRLIQHIVFALLTGLVFLRLGNSIVTLQYRVFAMFMLSIIPAIIMAQIEPFWIMARSTWIREETSKTFSGTVFAVTQLISELPYAIVCSTAFFLLLYYLVGFQSDSNRAGFFWVMTFLTELFAISIGTLIASFCASGYLASLFTPFLIVIMSLTCGVLSPPQSMPNSLYSDFLYNVNPVRYTISSLIANEFEGLTVECLDSEYYRFTPPAGQTCQAYAGSYVSTVGGYLRDEFATDVCEYCTFKTGTEFFSAFSITFGERGRDLGIMIAFIAFNSIMTIVFTKYLKFSNR